jgi:ABC-type spermidine/putrescine transport system permease subunit II
LSPTQPHYRSLVRGPFGWLLNICLVVAVIFLICPIVIVAIISFSGDPYLRFPPSSYSFRWYDNFLFADPSWVAASRKSLIAASLTAIVSVSLAIPTALALVRSKIGGKGWIELLLLAPLLISPMISAIALYGWMAPFGLVGSIAALVAGHVVLALPYAVLNISISAKALDPRLEQAASSLGAGSRQVFRRVTLPLLAPGIIAAAFFSFLTSFDDVIVSLFLSGREPTLQKRMWDEIRLEISPTVASASTLLILVTIFVFSAIALARARFDKTR